MTQLVHARIVRLATVTLNTTVFAAGSKLLGIVDAGGRCSGKSYEHRSRRELGTDPERFGSLVATAAWFTEIAAWLFTASG